jgi:hypothetical protein
MILLAFGRPKSIDTCNKTKTRGDRIMNISKRKLGSSRRAALILASVIVSSPIFAVSGVAAADNSTQPDGAIAYYSPASGDWYAGGPILDRSSESLPPKQTRLNPLVIGLCNAGASGLIIGTMKSTADGNVDLRCGTSTEGYIHIRNRHQTSWELQKGSGGVWDDYMAWATANALAWPSSVFNLAGSKRCYTTPIEVMKYVNGFPQYVKTFYPTIIVSTNNKLVITSIPSNSASC